MNTSNSTGNKFRKILIMFYLYLSKPQQQLAYGHNLLAKAPSKTGPVDEPP